MDLFVGRKVNTAMFTCILWVNAKIFIELCILFHLCIRTISIISVICLRFELEYFASILFDLCICY